MKCKRHILCELICLLLCFAVSVEAADATKSKLKIDPAEQGKAVRKELPAGRYVQYIPAQPADPPQLLVLVHGMLGPRSESIVAAEGFIQRWIPFAEKKGFILIAPAFDQKNFGSNIGPYGGFRALLGRQIGADEFLHQIIDRYKSLSEAFDGRFYLHGVSAGAQFSARYVVRHPDRIRGAVLAAPGAYPFPDPAVAWPDGMGPLKGKAHWISPDADLPVDIKPDPQGWVKAGGLPITVMVGSSDTNTDPKSMSQSDGPQKGANRLERAKSWFQDMKDLCATRKQPFHMHLAVIPDVGHSGAGLTPAAVSAIEEVITYNSQQTASRPAATH